MDDGQKQVRDEMNSSAVGQDDIDNGMTEVEAAQEANIFWEDELRDADATLAAMYPEDSRPLNLTWGEHVRSGGKHIEWHAPCGCAFHPEPCPHIHPCSPEHDRNRADIKELVEWGIKVIEMGEKDGTDDAASAADADNLLREGRALIQKYGEGL